MAAEFKERAAKMLADKSIYSIDYSQHVMRVSPLIWNGLKVNTKTLFLRGFYAACCADSSEFKVRILSDTSDEQLAEYDSVFGPTLNH